MDRPRVTPAHFSPPTSLRSAVGLFLRLCFLCAVLASALLPGWANAQSCSSFTPICIDITPYFPLPDNATFAYSASTDGGPAQRRTQTVLPGTVTVNGVATKAVRDDDGSIEYYSNDVSGIRLHQLFYPAMDFGDGVLRSLTVTLMPAGLLAPAVVNLGNTYVSSGSLRALVSGLGVLEGTYQSVTTIIGREAVTVPTGFFDTLKVGNQLTITIAGASDVQLTSFWFAQGVGVVKQDTLVDGSRTIMSLTDTNLPHDSTPNPFSLAQQTNVPRNTNVASSTQITGIDVPVGVSITGGSYSVNGGAFTTAAGTVKAGDTVTVQLQSAPAYTTERCATLIVSNVAGQFCAITAGPDTTPDAFTLPAQKNVPLNRLLVSHPIQVGGIDAPASINISNGTYSINALPFTSGIGTVNPGDIVQVRLTTAKSISTETCATLTIGGVAGQFCATTTPVPMLLQNIFELMLDD